MIDVHCHLEQKDYNNDRDEVIERCRKELKAVITSCAHPKDFDLTMQLVEKYKGFVFATVSMHPIYIKDITGKERNEFLGLIRENEDKIVGIGETGLDFHWVKEDEWREKQKQLFTESINLAKELGKPLLVHARGAFEESIDILEKNKAKNVLMHFFTEKNLLDRIIKNKWYVSVNTTVLTGKNIKKIVRDVPLEQLMLETDAPWLGNGKRNESTSVRMVAEKIAEIKKIPFEEVDKQTTENAVKFFGLTF